MDERDERDDESDNPSLEAILTASGSRQTVSVSLYFQRQVRVG